MTEDGAARYEIRELGVGGILDQAIRIVRDNLWPMFTILLPSLLFSVVMGVVGVAVAPAIDPESPPAERIAAVRSAMPVTLAVSALSSIGGILVLSWINASLVHFVSQRYLAHAITPGAALARGGSRFGPVLWTTILVSAVILLGFLLLIIPGIYFSFWYLLAQEVTVVEGTSGSAAMKRSRALIKGSLNQAFLLLLVLGLLGFTIGAGAGFFIPNPYLQAVVTSVLSSVVGLISLTALVVLYFSCRCKQENFDLERLATAMGERDRAGDDA